MEAKERNVEAWMIVLLINVNDYLPSDDLPFPLFCCLASSRHAKPEELKWAPPDPLQFFFCCLFMLCTSATNQQRGICKTLPDSPIADLLKDSKHRVTLLRNTLSENQEMAALWALMFYFQAYKPNHHTIWHKYTCYCVPSWNLVCCTRYNMGIAVISSYTIIINIVD